MPKRFLLTGVLLFSLAAPAAAEEHALVEFRVLSPEAALTLSRAALEDCRDKGFQVAVAVVDRFGVVQVILRDRFAGPHTPETARRKAWSAITFRTDTLEMSKLIQSGELDPGVRHVMGALPVGGGVRVEAAGSLVAGVGVSGAPAGAADDACARAGIEAIQDDLDF